MKKMLSFLLLVVFLSTLVPVARATGKEDFYIDRDAILVIWIVLTPRATHLPLLGGG